uniref:Uncharacterized protein n=1 Tax=Anguilla anguilla TaxID=7936 RepID=A0A0E9RQ74_ANGAN
MCLGLFEAYYRPPRASDMSLQCR